MNTRRLATYNPGVKRRFCIGDVVKLAPWDDYVGIVVALDVDDGLHPAPNVLVRWAGLPDPVDYRENSLVKLS